MLLSKIVSLDEIETPLELADLSIPEPENDEILIRVSACGVCHTELDEIEGRTPPGKLHVVLGYEVVGMVERTGQKAEKLKKGDRVGVIWIHSSNGTPEENLSPEFRATGRDFNGGYAEYMTVKEQYTCSIPEKFSDVQAAP
jgi:propanol-preferring alcohol dehydrogenase